MRVTVIIPTYNEKENIGELITAFKKTLDFQSGDELNADMSSSFRRGNRGLKSAEDVIEKTLSMVKSTGDDYQILVVDDNSPDGTGEIVKSLQKTLRNIFLLQGKKQGVGKAMIKGYLYALNNLKPDIVVSTEADFAYDPEYIPEAVGKIKAGYDVVVGSRHVGIGKTEGWTLTRKINHWVANKFFATWVAGVTEVYDHNGAFRAIRVKGVLDKTDFKKIEVTGFGFFSYFLFKLTQVTARFYELPVIYRFRKKGESKVSFNPKYFATYLHDVFEYIVLSFKIRLEKILEKGKMKQVWKK